VIAVVTGPGSSARFLARWEPVARVVVDADETMRHAFGVRGFPALFVLTESGHLSWTGLQAQVIPGLTAAAVGP
jgi:hypothetical protein